MTRYKLFNQIADLCSFEFVEPYMYKKMIQSGYLKEIHHDYGAGYYDLHIYMYVYTTENSIVILDLIL